MIISHQWDIDFNIVKKTNKLISEVILKYYYFNLDDDNMTYLQETNLRRLREKIVTSITNQI